MPDVRKPSRIVVPVDEPSIARPLMAWLSRFGGARMIAPDKPEPPPKEVAQELAEFPETLAWIGSALASRQREVVQLANELSRVSAGAPELVSDITYAERVHQQNIANMRLWFDDAGPILDMVGGSSGGGASGGTGDEPGALQTFYDNIIPVGPTNGTNKTFILPATPVDVDALHFEVSGQTWYYRGTSARILKLIGRVVTTTVAPVSGSLVRAWFRV